MATRDPRQDLRSSARTEGADRVASLLVTGFGVCGEEGVPLSERQQVIMVRNALMAWDGFDKSLQDAMDADDLLKNLSEIGRS